MRNGRPSSTALLIALEIGLLSRNPRFALLIAPGAGEFSRAMIAGTRPALARLIEQGHRLSVRGAARLVERLFVRGLALQHALRKRWIEERVRGALAEGFGQVVVVGAGLDTLAVRLALEFPGVRLIEVDHPATQRAKREALGARAGNLVFVPAELGRVRLEDALARSPEWNPLAPTLFIAEGLTMYLDAAQVEALLSSVRGPTGARRRLIFTFMEERGGRAAGYPRGTFLLNWWLRWKGEPFRWGLRAVGARPWLNGLGFSLGELAGAEELRRLYLRGTPSAREAVAAGEWMCVADAGLTPAAAPGQAHGPGDVVRVGASAAPARRTPRRPGAGSASGRGGPAPRRPWPRDPGHSPYRGPWPGRR